MSMTPETTNEDGKTKKARNRTPSSCNICRTRKVKCDRTRPVCNTCQANNFGHLCEYATPSWINIGKPPEGRSPTIVSADVAEPLAKRQKVVDLESEDRIKMLEGQVMRLTKLVETQHFASNRQIPYPGHPPVDIKDTIDFFSLPVGYRQRRSRVMVQGPLSWVLLVRQDPFLRLFWKVQSQKNQTNAEQQELLDKKFVNEPARAEVTKKRLTSKKGKLETVPLALGSEEYVGSILAHAANCMPNKRTMWMLIDRFFSHVYPMVPLIDEAQLMHCVPMLIGPREYSEDMVKSMAIEHDLQLCTLGILLIVLRLTSMSLVNNGAPLEEQINKAECEDLKYLLAHPVDVQAVAVAQLCLGHFRMLRKIDVGVLQLAYIVRLYISYAPEDGDGEDGSDSAPFTALLSGMTISSGLYRDPDNFQVEPKKANLWRKFWFAILSFQTYQNYTAGYPPLILSQFSDTKPPKFEVSSSNITDHNLEELIHLNIYEQRELDQEFNALLEVILNLEHKPTVLEVIISISKIERLVQMPTGSLEVLLDTRTVTTHSQRLVRVWHLIRFIEMKCFAFTIYYHLMLHFETHDGDSQLYFHYLKKLFEIVAEFALCFTKVYSMSVLVGECGYDIFYTRSAIKAILLSTPFLASTIVRLQQRLMKDCGNKTIRLLMKQCKDILSQLTEVIKIFGTNYYHAHRSSKLCIALLELLSNENQDLNSSGSEWESPQLNGIRNLEMYCLKELCATIDCERIKMLKKNIVSTLPDTATQEGGRQFKEGAAHKTDVYTNLSNHHFNFGNTVGARAPSYAEAAVPAITPPSIADSAASTSSAEFSFAPDPSSLGSLSRELDSMLTNIFDGDLTESLNEMYSVFGV